MVRVMALSDQGGAVYANGPVVIKEFSSLDLRAAQDYIESLPADDQSRLFVERENTQWHYTPGNRHFGGGWESFEIAGESL